MVGLLDWNGSHEPIELHVVLAVVDPDHLAHPVIYFLMNLLDQRPCNSPFQLR